MIRSPQDTNQRLCEVLGLDANRVKRVSLAFDAGRMPAVVVEQILDEPTEDGLWSFLRCFDLIEREDKS